MKALLTTGLVLYAKFFLVVWEARDCDRRTLRRFVVVTTGVPWSLSYCRIRGVTGLCSGSSGASSSLDSTEVESSESRQWDRHSGVTGLLITGEEPQADMGAGV